MNVKELIDLGRSAVWKAFENENLIVPEFIKKKYSEKRGVFTTLRTYPEHELRGCIGIPYPVYPLWYAVVYSSLQSAFKDPRFKPLKKEEFEKVIWEITLLSKPQEIKTERERIPEEINIGKDGLIVEWKEYKGLLLPQVPLEYGWSAEEFLDYTCVKAGLPKGCWKNKDVKIYKFSGEVYAEKEPFGEVVKLENVNKS